MISFKSVKKKYKKNNVLNDVSVDIGSGISFIMGQNGVGKTTLIKCISNLEDYEGEILFDEKKYCDVMDQTYVLFDDCPFVDGFSGVDNLLLFSEGKLKKEELLKCAEKFLSRNILLSKVKNYSNGQRKKLGIALVEILKPKYIILDEVSNGLDYESLKDLKILIKKWGMESSVIMTGHQFDFYNDIIDDLFLFVDGKIIKENTFAKGEKKLEEIYDEKLYKHGV